MADFNFNYHSGSGKTFIGMPRAQEVPTAKVEAFLAAPKALLKIRFQTTRFAPNHVVTIRNETDGWTHDVFGTYRNGGWDFFFEMESLSNVLTFKFVLDREQWMHGHNLVIPTGPDATFNESQVQFPSTSNRFLHGYDNFLIDETRLVQEAVPRNTREDIVYDVVVIGSGVGGGTLADALSDSGVKTLVLEAGGLTFPTHITNLPGDWTRLTDQHKVGHFVNEPGSDFLPGVHLSLGGRSVYWSGLIPRMHDWELQFWPTNIREFLNDGGYAPAETLMRKRKRLGSFQDSVVETLSNHLHGWTVEDVPRSRHQPSIALDGEPQNVLKSSTGVYSTADLLLTSMAFHGAAGRDNLTINLGHLVTHIETNDTTASAVVCQDLLGNMTRRYRGKMIVLAAGSLESPRIALNSELLDPNLKIGRGLTDHPAFFSAQYTIPGGNPFGGPDRHAKVIMYREDTTFNQHPFNVEVLINPIFWHIRNSDDDLQHVPNPSTIEMKFIFASLLDDDNFVRSNGIGKKLSVKVKRNATGIPHFDDARITRNAILSSLDVPFTEQEGMAYGNEGTVHHAGGTMRMSGNGSGVVNTDLKFEAYDNLYCVDPSVWPFIPAANPALTLAALSLRLSKHLKSRL
ncbi:MAG: hypothetical protein NPIRA04_22740 [Nitrospirales bacterium]|nr:MAG: hypothetical protein NPIRA04_22740 [Nitrospirales bacterium]